MSDEHLKIIGEIAVGFAWLEDAMSDFLHFLCRTPKAAVFTDRMPFDQKCKKVSEFVKRYPTHKTNGDILSWVKECKAVAAKRNDALHSKQGMGEKPGGWVRYADDKTTDITLDELAGIRDRIIVLYDQAIELKNFEETVEGFMSSFSEEDQSDYLDC